jgi:DNA-directed RNA polymerase alpha subunit
MSPDPLSTLGLTPLARHFLARRGIHTIDELCRMASRALLFQPNWLSQTERWDRQWLAGLALRDIRTRLAAHGLALRGDRYAEWVNEPLEKLELPHRAASLVRRLRLITVGDLLARTADDLLATSFNLTTMGEIMRTLAACGLHLSDGRPCGPDDLTW